MALKSVEYFSKTEQTIPVNSVSLQLALKLVVQLYCYSSIYGLINYPCSVSMLIEKLQFRDREKFNQEVSQPRETKQMYLQAV